MIIVCLRMGHHLCSVDFGVQNKYFLYQLGLSYVSFKMSDNVDRVKEILHLY